MFVSFCYLSPSSLLCSIISCQSWSCPISYTYMHCIHTQSVFCLLPLPPNLSYQFFLKLWHHIQCWHFLEDVHATHSLTMWLINYNIFRASFFFFFFCFYEVSNSLLLLLLTWFPVSFNNLPPNSHPVIYIWNTGKKAKKQKSSPAWEVKHELAKYLEHTF